MSAKAIAVMAFAAFSSIALTSPAQESGPYKVKQIQLVGGEGGFDYVTADPDARTLYVARSGPSGQVYIYNLDTLALLGNIPNTSAHGAAVDTASGFHRSELPEARGTGLEPSPRRR